MKASRRGFTLVELNLAMVFVALLLLGILALTIHVTRIYQRGILIKDVNQIGREVMGQMRRDIAAAQPLMVIEDNNVNAGRICLGDVSYVYNTAFGLKAGGSDLFVRGSSDPIALVRIIDPGQAWCEKSGATYVKGVSVDEAEFVAGRAAEMISRDAFATIGVHNISLRAMGDATDLANTKQALFNLVVRLGTSNLDAINVETCRPPTESQSDFGACFVVDYNTVIRAGNIMEG